jgi:uncharacterized membrane protein
MFDSSHFHPMIVHFPIALLVVGFLSDVVSIFAKNPCFKKAGFMLQVFGTLGVIAGYLSGTLFTGWQSFSGPTKEAFELHQDAAFLALLIMLVATLFRIVIVLMKRSDSWLRWISFILFLAGVAAITRTGFLGGNLVLNYLMGI